MNQLSVISANVHVGRRTLLWTLSIIEAYWGLDRVNIILKYHILHIFPTHTSCKVVQSYVYVYILRGLRTKNEYQDDQGGGKYQVSRRSRWGVEKCGSCDARGLVASITSVQRRSSIYIVCT